MFEMYDEEYISQRMSLRTPQKESLEILGKAIREADLLSNSSLDEKQEKVNKLYPTCTDFGREFASLAFVLATGVGKTRLMGAFITYLYTVYGLKNFFVAAPNLVIYEKLVSDFGNPSSDKYVFKGLDCFAGNPPQVVTGEEYRDRRLPLFDSEVRIFVYNISKFNTESTKMRAVNEWLGNSFIDELAKLEDLVLLMDESHHYHAAAGAQALDDLKPVIGLELTATPYFNVGSKQKKFTNAVYEYSLAQSIRDGYTRTPYALTRSDFKSYSFDEGTSDKVILQDAIASHENTRKHLIDYAKATGSRLVKPFVLVVCQDTEHANQVYDYVCSDSFYNGTYRNKTLVVHSNIRGEEKEENIKLLQSVESTENPIEIVIHVNKLKEGWDVNNLYTIVPLRTASSKVLREQMVGRGLRLPYGKRTGVKEIDMVVLTAHENFNQLIQEAQSADSIFNKEKVIFAEELGKKEKKSAPVNISLELNFREPTVKISEIEITREELHAVEENIVYEVSDNFLGPESAEKSTVEIAEQVTKELLAKKSKELDVDPQVLYDKNMGPLFEYMHQKTEVITEKAIKKFIPIPKIKVTDLGPAEITFVDFDIDPEVFPYTPSEQSLTFQQLANGHDVTHLRNQGLSLADTDPHTSLINRLRQFPEIDYTKCAELLHKLVDQSLNYFIAKYGIDGMQNIVYMNGKDLAGMIYKQMMLKDHCKKEYGFFTEEVVDYERRNFSQKFDTENALNLFVNPSVKGEVKKQAFSGIEKGVHAFAKFDSFPELVFARIIEKDSDVVNWLRPAPNQFDLLYEGGHQYQPDFVVEAEEKIYLVEVKGADRVGSESVIIKAKRGYDYCAVASRFAKANGMKPWEYLFIVDSDIEEGASFRGLLNRNRAGEIVAFSDK